MIIIKGIKKIWTDPVWSKVIASGIIGTATLSYAAFYSLITSVSIVQKATIVGCVVVGLLAVFYIFLLLYPRRKLKILVFLSAGGTCRDPMAKAIVTKLLEKRKLRHLLEIKAAGLGPLSKTEVSYAAKHVIKEMFNEDILAKHQPELLTTDLLRKADLILAMDKSLLLTPGKNLPSDKTFVLKEFFGSIGDVIDPWPDGKDVATLNRYRKCAEELRNILTNNLDHLIKVLEL